MWYVINFLKSSSCKCVRNWCIAWSVHLVTVCKFYLEYFSNRWIFIEIHEEIFSQCIYICGAVSCRAVIAQSVSRWATGWTTEVLGFHFWRGLGIFLFTTASRTALGHTHSPIQRVLGATSLGVKRPGREADHSSSSSATVKEWVELYLHSIYMSSWCGA